MKDLTNKFGIDNVGLYGDDGLLVIEEKGVRQANKAHKDIHQIFSEHGLRATVEINNETVSFLDVSFDIRHGVYKLYRKSDNNPLYNDERCNHPPNIIKQLPSL